MRFAAPEYLLLLWVLLALAAVRLVARLRRRRRARAFAAAAPYVRLVPGLSGSRRGFRDILRFGAATALVLALARPQFGQRLAVLVREGIDVIVAIDTSASMMAEDLKPNRLETAKRAVIGLSERLRGDRIGIVVFSGSAFVQCPLTVDAKAVRLLVDAIGPETVPDPGTALGAAIDRATSAFPQDEPRFKALVLITDGEGTAGDPLAAARRAADKGVRIFTVGLGAPRGEPIPVRNPDGAIVGYKKDRQGEVVLSRLDQTMLERLADLGDGRYFRASPALNELDALYAEIDAMEKREIRGGFHAHYEDRFHWFAVAAFILLAFARLIGEKTNLPRAALALFLVIVLAPPAIADVGSEVHDGNRAYQRGEPEIAAEHYLRALSEDPDRPEILYNLGNALYVGQHFVDAEAAYGTAAEGADSTLAGPLSYNLGNALFRQGRYAEAVDAYKAELRRDPGDEDARWNLELALRKLKQQEQEQQQQQQQQQQQKQQEDDQQQQGDQQQQDDQRQQQQQQQQEDEQDRQDQEQENQDSGGDEEEPGGQSEQGEEESESSPEEHEGEAGREAEQAMSAEEAARLLEALGNEEQELLRERFRSRGRRVDVEKDW